MYFSCHMCLKTIYLTFSEFFNGENWHYSGILSKDMNNMAVGRTSKWRQIYTAAKTRNPIFLEKKKTESPFRKIFSVCFSVRARTKFLHRNSQRFVKCEWKMLKRKGTNYNMKWIVCVRISLLCICQQWKRTFKVGQSRTYKSCWSTW